MSAAVKGPKPKRIQRSRAKGWKMPPNTVYVGRPSIFGNPFIVDDEHDAAWTIRMFRSWLVMGARGTGGGLRRLAVLSRLPELRGKDLACWCKVTDDNGNPVPCHADILLELANS